MAELNLNQIIDKLNTEFTGDTRKLVFWYDDNADFAEDIQSVELSNAKVYFLRPDNQFYTKYFLERVDTTTNYLIYAPFPKPDVKDNHLEDTLLYSKRFFADRASLLCLDLGIAERYKPVIERHISFFGSKERTGRFYDLEIDNYNESNILTGMLCAVCRTRICSFEEAVRIVLTESELEDNQYLAEFARYDLTGAFWKLCEQQFGYTDSAPTLEKLLATLFVTYTEKYTQIELPKAWGSYVSFKSGNVIAFLDSLMNSVLYREKFDGLSDHIAQTLNAAGVFASCQPEDLVDCDTFRVIDQILIKWMTGRLAAEDTGAALNGLPIPELCEKRRKMHFGDQKKHEFLLLENAYALVKAGDYHSPDGFSNVIRSYREKDYLLDQHYRYFYFHFDKVNCSAGARSPEACTAEDGLGHGLENADSFEQLRELVERIYTNEYMANLLPKWNAGLAETDSLTKLPLQRNFYTRYVRPAKEKERTVVIISDAMRYEVGQELFLKMQEDPKSTVHMEMMLTVLPSVTRLGMAALLPHNSLAMTNDYKVLADDVLCDSLAGRQTVLKKHCPDSACVQFDDIKSMKRDDLRSVFTGRQVVYIYQNQIDARGDKPNTEDEVFIACEEAIQEIIDLIRRISGSANTHRFLITADHGFIYKRDKLAESDKIGVKSDKQTFSSRRFIIADKAVVADGVQSMSLGDALENNDERYVSFPISGNVFKMSGGGQNYVHGGSSPQEMLVPVIDIKMEKGHMDTRPAQIALVSIVQKITNLITSMDFIQSEPVSDTVKAANYRLVFLSEDGSKISNENILAADSRDPEGSKRMTRMRFQFKNQKYDKDRQYYLVAYDESTGIEAWRHPVIMDLAFGEDFGF